MIDVRTTPAPIEPVTPIKPSEAIRLGCLTTGPYRVGLFDGTGQKTCALGAMMVGHGYGPGDEDIHYSVPKLLLPQPAAPCPGDGCRNGLVGPDMIDVVGHLNDTHRWSRERIADWLQGLGL